MNRVIPMGRLIKSPDIRYTWGKHSVAIARYILAVDRKDRKGQDSPAEQQTADSINRVTFDRTTELAEKYFRQEVRVLVSGRIQIGSYVNREGRKIHTADIVLDDQGFADSKGAPGKGSEQRQT